MTPAERKALLFLAALTTLGVGARAAGVGALPDAVVAADDPATERQALARQIAAVDSARESRRTRAGRTPRRRERPGGRAPTPAVPTTIRTRPPRLTPTLPLDVDRADSAALEALPGVGPALAARIVADRTARGAFGSLQGLSRVPGIGPRLEARLEPVVTFSAAP